MAWNIRTSSQVGADLEIFKFPPNAQGFASIVLDATSVACGADGSMTMIAGTPLIKDSVTSQYKRYTGSGTVRGILAHRVDFADGSSKSDAPAAMAFHGEVFRADRILDFTASGSTYRTALPTCRFD